MKMIDLITKKRNGEVHTAEEIKYIIDGVKSGTIPDYQISAWLMAVYFNGMNFEESAILTEAMAKSGDMLDLSDIGDCIIDKHSTGGVGDKITLILIPLLAAAGVPVAKLSGRGLGHTGGTIDKLESIPGFNTSLDMKDFINQVKEIGAAIAGQTAKLTPADGKLYALRDVTCTVDCMPLIASSVVSKKVASGANIIVLDVKYGNGAFVKTPEDAELLSKIMVEIGKRLNRSITAVITSMDQPLGYAIGNSLEVIESINTLKNQGPKDVTELSLHLGAISLLKAGKCSSIEEGTSMLQKLLENGKAFEKLKEIVKCQGGMVEAIDDIALLPQAEFVVDFVSTQNGYVKTLDALKVAQACKLLGAGREKKEDSIDYSVGVVLNKKIGDCVEQGEVIARIHANSKALAQQALENLEKAYIIDNNPCCVPNLIHKVIG